ncbi:GGDEF domain-containing protein [Novosphingobium malaysiense]|uniref:diguanylate cyclase n=1 Tax=Novosphingobium malaysiense TaxID=1348853 RepID=A0A0B1ZM11_9SPHN|nr:GGDEF domain-containing protein [Novosphingobium malaysiense]KHK90228.1 response regulator PleD [Novosphingobium malaysiense]
MRFYRATAFLFPKHYEYRILFICLGAVHFPLIAYIGLEVTTGQWQAATLVVLLLATLVAAGLGLAAIRALLSPVSEATEMLRAVQDGEPVGHIPRGAGDLVGRLLGSVATAANESAARIKRLVDTSERDALTGIRNRRGFVESAREVLLGNHTAVMALIDIDHFKLINDQFGHDAGDDVLKTIALHLESELRRKDLVGRWGGEEFAVLLPDTMLDEARLIIERLRASIALDRNLDDRGWPVTLSCGLALIRDFAQFDEACQHADTALYGAKSQGRNRIHISATE